MVGLQQTESWHITINSSIEQEQGLCCKRQGIQRQAAAGCTLAVMVERKNGREMQQVQWLNIPSSSSSSSLPVPQTPPPTHTYLLL